MHSVEFQVKTVQLCGICTSGFSHLSCLLLFSSPACQYNIMRLWLKISSFTWLAKSKPNIIVSVRNKQTWSKWMEEGETCASSLVADSLTTRYFTGRSWKIRNINGLAKLHQSKLSTLAGDARVQVSKKPWVSERLCECVEELEALSRKLGLEQNWKLRKTWTSSSSSSFTDLLYLNKNLSTSLNNY